MTKSVVFVDDGVFRIKSMERNMDFRITWRNMPIIDDTNGLRSPQRASIGLEAESSVDCPHHRASGIVGVSICVGVAGSRLWTRVSKHLGMSVDPR